MIFDRPHAAKTGILRVGSGHRGATRGGGLLHVQGPVL